MKKRIIIIFAAVIFAGALSLAFAPRVPAENEDVIGVVDVSGKDGEFLGDQDVFYKAGDINKDGITDKNDAVYLLMNRYFPEQYPLYESFTDYNGDGKKDDSDVVYLIKHISDPAVYSIEIPADYSDEN